MTRTDGTDPMYAPGTDEPVQVGVECGYCASGDLHFVACPEHEWAIASICYGCLHTHKITDCCPDCGWRGESDD